MTVNDLIRILEKHVPGEYACDWDNVGLLCGRGTREVRRILICVDATDAIVRQAVETGADFILTHHPMIFGRIGRINDGTFLGRRLLTLAENRIACYAMHTNFDSVPGGMADLAADRMGLRNRMYLEGSAPEGMPAGGIGIAGDLAEPMSLEEFAAKAREAFGCEPLRVFRAENAPEKITRAAIVPGSGKSEIPAALEAGAQVLLTGDIGHHDGIDAAADGLTVMDAGHYGLEQIFIGHMKTLLESELPSDITVEAAGIVSPYDTFA